MMDSNIRLYWRDVPSASETWRDVLERAGRALRASYEKSHAVYPTLLGRFEVRTVYGEPKAYCPTIEAAEAACRLLNQQ